MREDPPETNFGGWLPAPSPPALGPGVWGEPALTLGDGDGLEAVQLPQQAAPLGGVQAVDEIAGPLRSVQRLHRLLLGVGAQRPPRRRPRAGMTPVHCTGPAVGTQG